MTADLQPASVNPLATVARTEFTLEQVGLIKRLCAKDANDDELTLFLGQCRRTGLDPLAKQIYLVRRKAKDGYIMAIQIGIDGYRLIADRTGKYAGNDDPVFDSEENPQRATVTVYKIVEGVRCPFAATARWSQYYPGDAQGFMWKRMPHLMLGKCAEALALRRAFPAELSGLYIAEELEETGRGELIFAPDGTPLGNAINPAQIGEINDLIDQCRVAGVDFQLPPFLKWLDVPSLDQLPQRLLGRAVYELKRRLKEATK